MTLTERRNMDKVRRNSALLRRNINCENAKHESSINGRRREDIDFVNAKNISHAAACLEELTLIDAIITSEILDVARAHIATLHNISEHYAGVRKSEIYNEEGAQ